MQLFKFSHTENTSNFKTQTAENGGFCEELLSENDLESVLVNFCCYELVPMLLRHFRKLMGVEWGGGGGHLTIFF